MNWSAHVLSLLPSSSLPLLSPVTFCSLCMVSVSSSTDVQVPANNRRAGRAATPVPLSAAPSAQLRSSATQPQTDTPEQTHFCTLHSLAPFAQPWPGAVQCPFPTARLPSLVALSPGTSTASPPPTDPHGTLGPVE